MDELKVIFEDIKDPRDSRGKKHNLLDIIIMSVCGILCGCIDFDDIEDYAIGNIEFFNEYLLLWNGVPTSKTFREVFKVIDVEEFLGCFMNWVKTIIPTNEGQHIVIDGKAIRAATEKIKKGNIPYIVNAYIAGLGITISQLKVENKSNEITAIPKILDMIAIKGSIITIDAIGTQHTIMDKIIENEGDFVLALKKNQKGAYSEVEEYFEQEDLLEDKVKVEKSKTTYDSSHGRIETRKCIVSTDVEWFKNNEKNGKWEHIECIAKTINTREINDVKTEQTKYYVSSTKMSADEMNKIVRDHWQIENNLHWVLDVTFKEDLSRSKTGNLMENFSLLRKMCLNIIKQDDRFGKISIKRKMNRYKFHENAFRDLLFEVIPNMNNLVNDKKC